MLPETVTAFPLPTFFVANAPIALPPMLTVSPPNTPFNAAVPPSASTVVASYVLFAAVKPITFKFAALTFALNPVCCVSV